MIKKGNLYMCIGTVHMSPSNDIAYKAGYIYKSEKDRCITDDLGNKDHIWEEPNIYFRQVSKDSKISYLDPDSIDVERFDSNLDLLISNSFIALKKLIDDEFNND